MSTNQEELSKQLQDITAVYENNPGMSSISNSNSALTLTSFIPKFSFNKLNNQEEKNAAMRQFQKVIQICEARKAFNNDLIRFAKNASYSEIQAYIKRNFPGSIAILYSNETDWRSALRHHFSLNIKMYQNIKDYVENLDIDRAYLLTKLQLICHLNPKFHKASTTLIKKTEQERYFLQELSSRLKPYFNNILAFLLEKDYIKIDDNMQLTIDRQKFAQREIDTPINKLRKLYYSIVPVQTDNKTKQIFTNEEIKQFEKVFVQEYLAEKDKVGTMLNGAYQISKEIPLKMDNTHLVEICLLYKEPFYHALYYLTWTVRSLITQMKRRIKFIEDIDKILVEAQKVRNELKDMQQNAIDIDETLNLEITKLRENSNEITRAALTTKLEILQKDLIFKANERDQRMEGFAKKISELNANIDAICSQLKSISNQINNSIKAANKLNLIDNIRDTNNKNFGFVQEEEKFDKRKIDTANMKDGSQKKNPLTSEEWKEQVLTKREEKEIMEKENKKEEIIKAIKQDDTLKNYNILSEEQITARELRIKSFITKNITELFEKLYSYQFGDEDLKALVHALKEKGENIEIEYKASSHYTIIIQNTIGYCLAPENLEGKDSLKSKDDLKDRNSNVNFSEKGSAFTPHGRKAKAQKNSKYFAKFLIENIQSVFFRAGYTIEALGLNAKIPDHLQGQIKKKPKAEPRAK